jgi:predicted DNA-binding transcriptional regulator YafY
MLTKLLDLIRSSGTVEVNHLAEELDVSPRQVTMMLEDLERIGKIRRTDFCQSSGCGDCPAGKNCGLSQQPTRIWSFEEKWTH